ncbi:putative periplasmic oligopeptide-binding protein, partial [Chlamydia psittaci 84-8471/1]
MVRQEVSSVYNFAFDPIKNVKQIQQGVLSEEHVGFYTKDEKTLVIELESPTSHFLKL